MLLGERCISPWQACVVSDDYNKYSTEMAFKRITRSIGEDRLTCFNVIFLHNSLFLPGQEIQNRIFIDLIIIVSRKATNPISKPAADILTFYTELIECKFLNTSYVICRTNNFVFASATRLTLYNIAINLYPRLKNYCTVDADLRKNPPVKYLLSIQPTRILHLICTSVFHYSLSLSH